MEINRRLKGLENFTPGKKVPDIMLKDIQGYIFDLYEYDPPTPYILILFWSAGCSHCIETVDELVQCQKADSIARKLSVVAVSMDESEGDIAAWNQKVKELEGWIHLHPEDSFRSKVASDYSVISMPWMILVDGKTKEIISLPSNVHELKAFLP
jgi:thioredoxin-related protein